MASVVLGIWGLVASNLFAWQAHYDRALSSPLLHLGAQPIYAPWAIVRWALAWVPIVGFAPFRIAVLAGVAVSALALVRLIGPHVRQGDAHWATWGELRAAGCLGHPGSGIVLGRLGGRILRYTGDGHVFALGNTGSGKTTCLIPTILECPHSLFIFDPKDSLYAKTAGRRAQLGRVIRLAPLDPCTDGYDPLSAVRVNTDDEFPDVALLTSFLTNPDGNPRRDDATAHFQEVVANFFNGALLYGLHSGLATSCAAFNDLITTTKWEDLVTCMQHFGHSEVARAGAIASRIVDRELGSVQTTASRALAIFSDPRIAHFTSQATCDLSMLREEAQPCTIYYSVPFADQERLRPLSRLLIRQLIGRVTSRLHGWSHRLVMAIDEFPSLNRITILSDALNFVREYGIQLILLTPSLEEVIDDYGVHHNFLEGSYVQLLYGVTDASVAERFARRIGMHEVRNRRVTRHWSGGRGSTTDEQRQEPLLSATALLRQRVGWVTALVGPHAIRLRQARYYQERRWQQWSQLPVPTTAHPGGTYDVA